MTECDQIIFKISLSMIFQKISDKFRLKIKFISSLRCVGWAWLLLSWRMRLQGHIDFRNDDKWNPDRLSNKHNNKLMITILCIRWNFILTPLWWVSLFCYGSQRSVQTTKDFEITDVYSSVVIWRCHAVNNLYQHVPLEHNRNSFVAMNNHI